MNPAAAICHGAGLLAPCCSRLLALAAPNLPIVCCIQGTASSMAKQREKMELAAAARLAAEDGMVKMDPEELSMMKSELARLQSLIVKLQGADVENAQLKRMLETLR